MAVMNSGGVYLGNTLLATQDTEQNITGKKKYSGNNTHSGDESFTGKTTFTKFHIYGVTPQISFHYNNSADVTSYIVENSSGTLSLKESPEATNSKTSLDLVTVAYVNDPTLSLNVLHRDGNETATGNKTFTGTTTMSTATVTDTLNIPGGKIWIA